MFQAVIENALCLVSQPVLPKNLTFAVRNKRFSTSLSQQFFAQLLQNHLLL